MDQATQPRTIGHGLRPVADNLWIADAGRISAAGLPMPIRMTVIRLSSGDLLLHSPTRFSHALRDELEQLGPIKYLVAPNVAHWMFLPDWQAALPNARLYAAPGLADRRQIRRNRLRIDRELTDVTPDEWSPDLQLVLISAPMFTEVELFHRPSRTLILTDLVQNLAPEGLGILPRTAAHMLGITAPDGKAPAHLRLLLRLGGRAVRLAAARLVALAPERVVFAHGRWFESGGTQQLRRSLGWLLDSSPEARRLMRDLRGTRIVITGASSGIGRAAALALAREGASLVLAARREEVLKAVAVECETLGGRAIAVATDVTDAEAVQRLAEQAVQTFGSIDVWINNAGTGVFGAYQDADIALHRKTIEVNLLGTMNGAYAVLPILLRQRRGTLINNISLGGWAPTPFAAAYTASKFGLRGFSASLRQELAAHEHIHVCSVFPAMVDTPGFVHGANMSGRNLDPGPLLYRPEDVAETFVQLIRAPRDEVAVGWPARLGQISYALARRPTERLMSTVFRFLLARAKGAPRTTGAVLAPIPAGTAVSGDWLRRKQLPPAGQLSKMGLAIGLGGIALLLIVRAGRPARSSHRRSPR
ncbi:MULTISPECIES: SDR family oxidoreductase [unclassified Bradyrhizobium]|uniref:SDR family oxidoreductase n=1 Tax=unclassified Bradyrhizobium TaxID=2631580 RepID=UPI0028EBDB9A|nr:MULTISPECIES: SDR family oxidoreductase [unclassified Bradyrhizobium]